MILVDGYNLLHAFEELAALADRDMEAARDALTGRLAEYAAARGVEVEVVFDGAGGETETSRPTELLTVTFTRAGSTADAYIEKWAFAAAASGPAEHTLVTGDYDQQKVAGGAGMLRVSSREFAVDVTECMRETSEALPGRSGVQSRTRLGDRLPADVREQLLRFRKSRES